jgi:hypothetical protein
VPAREPEADTDEASASAEEDAGNVEVEAADETAAEESPETEPVEA